jgi:hypothetical protein
MFDNPATVNYWADNLLQDQISFREGRPDRERLGNKAVDVPVNTIPAARSDIRPNNLLS